MHMTGGNVLMTQRLWSALLAGALLLVICVESRAQTLHQLVAAANPGDTIILNAGVYTLDQTLFINKPLTIVGQGRDQTFIQAGAGMTDDRLFNIGGTSGNPLSGVRLADFTLDGMSNANVDKGIILAHATNQVLEDLRVRNIAGSSGPHGIQGTTNVTHSTFARNEILNIGVNNEWGAGLRLSWGSSDNIITHNYISDVGRGGILLNDNLGPHIITHNTVQNIGVLQPGGQHTRLGIEIWGTSASMGTGSIIEDNTVDHWISVDANTYVAVRRNSITGSTLHSGAGWGGIEVVGSASRVVVTDNTVTGGSLHGIVTSNDGHDDLVFVARNLFQNTERTGGYVKGTDTGNDGSATRWYYHDNRFEGAGEDGFRIRGPANSIVLDGNEFINNGPTGILNFTNGALRFDTSGSPAGGNQIDNLVIINNTFSGSRRTVAGSFPGSNLYWANNTQSNVSNNGLSSTGFPEGVPPTPSIGVNGNLLVGAMLDLELLGMSSVPLTDVLWDMGEGIPLTGEQIQYAYFAEGEYLVSAIAWTDYGFGVLAQTTLTIVPEPATIALLGLCGVALLRRQSRGNIG